MPVELSGPGGRLRTFALFDDGSTITLVERDIARRLGLKGAALRLEVQGIVPGSALRVQCTRVTFEISGELGSGRIESAMAVPEMHLPAQTLAPDLVRYIAKHEGVFIQPYVEARPAVLLGQDNWPLLVSGETRAVRNSALAISRLSLGWVAHGSAAVAGVGRVAVARGIGNESTSGVADRLDDLVRRYFLIEDMGVRVTNGPPGRHREAMELLRRTSRRVGEHWETGLLWRASTATQVDSRTTAWKRLRTLEKRLDKDSEYAALYYREMNRLVEQGYAVEVAEDAPEARVWYLPHFGVRSPSRPGKLRLVFDAAAKSGGKSLNDQLLTGPDMLQSLVSILIRFRQHAVAFKADIRDMYLRVRVRSEDRGALRFLWRGRDRKARPTTLEMTRLIFGANSSQSSAIFVKDENARGYGDTLPRASRSVINDFYVDDYLSGASSTEEAVQLIRDVIKINKSADFELHGWASNDSGALREVPKCNKGEATGETRLGDRDSARVLGLYWDTRRDELSFNVGIDRVEAAVVAGVERLTKRELLRVIMSVYDPLGLISPFTLRSRLLMQAVWRSGVGWDDALGHEEREAWAAWVAGLSEVARCRVPRGLRSGAAGGRAQLHVFCDASSKAFAAAVYLLSVAPRGPKDTRLILARARVAPLRPMTIPRLELQAALLGARLLRIVSTELEFAVERRVLWSDSQTVLRWLATGTRSRQVFVEYRLGEIEELTSGAEWRWVPSELVGTL